MPTSHLFEVALAVDGSELFSTKVSKLSRRYNRLKKKISTLPDDLTTDVWTCIACSYAENGLDCLRCTMCAAARPRGSRSVLLVSRDSTHPVALAAARGCGRKPPKARGAASTAPRESPPQGAKDKANERIAAQLAQRTTVPVAEVVRSPESSPDGPLAAPPAATCAGAGIIDVAGGDLDNSDGSPLLPSRGLGRKTTGLELGDRSPNFSPDNSPESPTDNKVSKYSFFACLMHYMDGNKIS